jgi:hypothetical protein
MYQLQPRNQLYQTLTVDENGGGSVGYFIGEVAGVRHNYFRLGASALARLRRQLTGLPGVRTERLGGPTTVVDTIIAGNRSVRVTEGGSRAGSPHSSATSRASSAATSPDQRPD